ncbi:uncharacterized protein [Clytia hemisphaerica]|uniref:uncharacterized protein n=1 Tax=Clytia hemisphaerica TaxID=252671 RepID=UPI0034D4CF8A
MVVVLQLINMFRFNKFLSCVFLLQLVMERCSGTAIWLENVHCATYIDYVETDPGHARYLPFIVRLHRCQGSVGVDKPSIKACVPSNISEVEIVTQNLHTFRYETIKVLNHTSCTSRCTTDSSSCNKYQKWNQKRCRCECKTRGEPKKDTCCAPKVWSQHRCNCECLEEPQQCHRRKEWRKEACGCKCKDKYFQRCRQLNLTLDLDNCRCMNLIANSPQVTCISDTITLSLDIVVLICVSEALLIAFVYIVYYISCRTDSKERSHGGETSNLLNVKKENGHHEEMDLQSQSTVFAT